MKKTQSSFLEKVDLGARLAVANALAEHNRKGKSIVVSKNGKLITIPPHKIRISKMQQTD